MYRYGGARKVSAKKHLNTIRYMLLHSCPYNCCSLQSVAMARLCFGTIAQTVCEYLGVDASSLDGHSVLQEILK